jgi:endonuclease YncB( thermonuclease family)
MRVSVVSLVWRVFALAAIVGPGAMPQVWAEDAPAAAGASLPSSSDLPTVVIDQRPVHTIPDQEPPPPPTVTIRGPDGSLVAFRALPPSSRRSFSQSSMEFINGEAEVVDGIALKLHGRSIHLFGVRLPPDDRCADGAGVRRSCAGLARDALAARLKINAAVSCGVPPGQRVAGSGAICQDVEGVDLGRLLVAQGLAIADRAQSFEYVEAESAARASRRGLWDDR